LCLALGIAANVTVFTPVNTLLLRPLPFTNPDRVVNVYTTLERERRFEGNWSYADYVDVGNAGGALSGVGLYVDGQLNISGVDEAERVQGSRLTASVFPLLGIRTVLGRGFRADEDEVGKVMLISYGFWQRKFAGDSSVIGRALTVNGQPYTVVGVVQDKIKFPEFAEVWLPLEPGEMKARRDWRDYNLVARLAPNVTPAQAQARIVSIMRDLQARFGNTNKGWTAWVEPYRENVARDVRPMMLIMLGAVAFVLLIACANVANLMLARATNRQREIAVRLALGAGRRRIVQQLLTESVILGVVGGGLGALLGIWGVEAIVGLLPAELPFWMVFNVDGRVLSATLVVSVLTGVVFGLVPALQASSPRLGETLKEHSRSSTGGVRSARLRSTLVVTELVLSVVLLIGATLMIQSFIRMRTARLGFDPSRVLTFQLAPEGSRYAADSTRLQFYDAVTEQIGALPGVAQVGAVAWLPVRNCCSWVNYQPEGKTYAADDVPNALYNVVTPGFLDALRIPLVAGRNIDRSDTRNAPRVALVSRAFAEREWRGQNPVGRRLRLSMTDTTWTTVVGVFGSFLQDRRVSDTMRPQILVPLAQSSRRTLYVAVRATSDAAALSPLVRAEIRRIDPDVPLAEVKAMPRVIAERMFEPRVYGFMFSIFAASALVLAVIGIYGVMAYSVAQRTHEFGVRMALGAQRRDVLLLVLRAGARLVVIGLAIGVPSAFAMGRGLRGLLYGVRPGDPATFIGIPVLLGVVALLASMVPARRATRVAPI
ncbi:MAG TPA: ABC transporter permease, partial [Gemmatimonadaceae bacterium]|nr:ABC transporter permease [Gemmatimonadaceae bacterium]